MAEQVKLKLIKSPTGRTPAHRGTLRALGLWKIGEERVHNLTPQIKGMIRHVGYLLEVAPAK